MLNHMYIGLSKTIQTKDFTHLLKSMCLEIESMGLSIDRIQIPMNKISGLRHPRYAVIVLTFSDGALDTIYIPHERYANKTLTNFEHLRNTPFAPIIDHPNTVKQLSLQVEDVVYDRLRELKAEGYTEYASANMTLPQGTPQLFSIATKSVNGFNGDVEVVLGSLLQAMALCLYAAYQSNVANALAETYLGLRTGENVLTGSMYRGAQEVIDAGVMFCDVRGFTAMSERLGAEGVVQVMNDVFQIIEEEVQELGGEILKFIGDALLIIFPREHLTDRELSHRMIHSALDSVTRVESHGESLGLPLSVGFGCHIGEVLYGNIGTKTRLDFTVMGPAVNLTSRLESMCKSLGAQLTVSTTVADGNREQLQSFGLHSVKGISEPVEIWGVPVNS